ncbi:hypothetical protein BC937DRAFT_92220 [Endogone sp. FLAS-F59071]|nr:hypothetical protein BC937DRAFT_92220 [Endogone sp. FLAS-F59071]|eukprot:RUS15620.1 hypothetical protein BC937DRAFT_92220 [Endogone sp. FLAS-F59071]
MSSVQTNTNGNPQGKAKLASSSHTIVKVKFDECLLGLAKLVNQVENLFLFLPFCLKYKEGGTGSGNDATTATTQTGIITTSIELVVNPEQDGVYKVDADDIEDEGLRNSPDNIVAAKAQQDERTIITNDSDFITTRFSSYGTILLWGGICDPQGRWRNFRNMNKDQKYSTIIALFRDQEHLRQIKSVRDNHDTMLATLSGKYVNGCLEFQWVIQRPTGEELDKFFNKRIEKIAKEKKKEKRKEEKEKEDEEDESKDEDGEEREGKKGNKKRKGKRKGNSNTKTKQLPAQNGSSQTLIETGCVYPS